MNIVLASKSPRRREILSMLGIEFSVDTADIEEKSDCKSPAEYTMDISAQKGRPIAEKYGNGTLVISCDTVVAIDGKILGKPKNITDAENMLRLLSNKTHKVISGLSLFYNGKVYTKAETTEVTFGVIPERMIKLYAASGDPLDKAGAYAAQGKTSLFIEKINGCYFNVVGFPVSLFRKMLEKIGIDVCNLIF